MKLREKMHRVIYRENKFCAGSKTGFFTLLRIVCTDQKTTSAIAVLVVAVVDFFSVDCLLLCDGVSMELA